MKVNKFEIWRATVVYEDSNESKERPVLILNYGEAAFVDVAKITSHSKRDIFDVEMVDW